MKALLVAAVLPGCSNVGPYGNGIQRMEETTWAQIQVGKSTSDDVLRILGAPWRKMEFPRQQQVAWDYRRLDTWGYQVDYSVMIDARGIVADKVAARIDPPDRVRPL